jgi:WXG100 family type VII secretion target
VAGTSAHDATMMAQAATQVSSAVDQIRGLQNNLNSSHDSLMGNWVGSASAAFTNAYTEFNADFNKVIAALDNLGVKLKQSGANYTTIEEANRTSANKISAALGG